MLPVPETIQSSTLRDDSLLEIFKVRLEPTWSNGAILVFPQQKKMGKMYDISVFKTLTFRQEKINEVLKKMSLVSASTSQTRLHRLQFKNGNMRQMGPLPEPRMGLSL